MQLECMSLLFSPHLSQILTTLLETLISLQGIRIYIYVCNACKVILFLFGTMNFTTKGQLQLVWTSFFWVVDQLGPVFKGPVAVANCLVFRDKTGLNWTRKHYQQHILILFFLMFPDFLTIFTLITIFGNAHRPCQQYPTLSMTVYIMSILFSW